MDIVRVRNKFHRYILINFLDKEVLQKIKMNKESMQSILSNKKFLEKIALDTENQRHTCLDVYNLTVDILNEICSDLPADFMNYSYEYILNKSFSNAVTITLEEKYETAVLLYINFLKVVFEYDDLVYGFDEFSSFKLLTEEELENCNYPHEYNLFIKEFKEKYVYQLMRLSREITEYNTIDHIAAVHFVSMHVAKQLDKIGVPVNISIVSAVAIGHDIGKYGCRKKEQHRVPYLHYYYTDQWFKKIDTPVIAHIATNHSTWDLELENLPVEELILIYSDFRVKNRFENGKSQMAIYTLDDSFEVILDKLDNVDAAKEKRYRKVYNKLKDFENYMHSLGINTDFSSEIPSNVNCKDFSLDEGEEIINNLKFMSIKHNISLMNKLNHDVSLSSMIEAARSESDWNNIRYYLNIFEEYSTHLTQGQKLLTLNFLYELFINSQSDIRKISAQLLGNIITSFDEEYRKEVPEDVLLKNEDINSIYLWEKYLDMIINPDHKKTLQQKQWISGTLDTFLESVFKNCRDNDKKEYIQVLMRYYQNEDLKSSFELLQAGLFIPIDICTSDNINTLLDFAVNNTESENETLKIAALILIEHILKGTKGNVDVTNIVKLIKAVDENDRYTINFIKFRITSLLEIEQGYKVIYETLTKMEKSKIQSIFLDNLKTATHWIIKSVSIDFISYNTPNLDMVSLLQAATHFCNLVKVSANATVRYKAGAALLKIGGLLPKEHINEISIELLKGLEIDSFEFSKYIPEYLGQFVLLLDPAELNEFIDEVQKIFKASMSSTSCLCLDTIGVIINHYAKYKSLFNEEELVYNKRLVKMLGIIFSGLASFDEQIKQEAFLVIGKNLFGSKQLNMEQKSHIFNIISKKLLNLIPVKESTDIFFYHNAASLNHIYRFVSDYILENGMFKFEPITKVAFFSGTFDPFSLSHKGIAQEIRNLGFEVYLAVDEFSWSKRTQPRLIRRQITSMSIADEFGMYIFPDDISVNIANSNDLDNLRNIFNGKEIYIVVGSDVVDNASAYKNEPTSNSIHNFNHIVFNRSSMEQEDADNDNKSNRNLERINAEVVMLTLPVYLEDISSTQIRDNIDDNTDISYLIDLSAQNFIYEKSLYLREPQYKNIIKTKSIGFYVDALDEEIKALISKNINRDKVNADEFFSKPINVLKIVNEDDNKIIGFSLFHSLSTSLLYDEFGSTEVANYVRERTAGNITVIDGLYIDEGYKIDNIIQIILMETLAHSLKNDFTYALFHNVLSVKYEKTIYDTLELQGFANLHNDNNKGYIYGVDMKFPIALVLDVESFIKEPLSSNEKVLEIVSESRKNLQKALIQLYPDSLVLTFDNEIIQHKMVKKICDINSVPNKILEKRVLGEYMCVPFGAVLKGKIVPNTVTKSIHTDKVFNSDVSEFTISEYPFYSPLINQVKTIKSFNRPVILVDDLLNKGYRMKVIDPMFKNEDIKVEKTIVGILSAKGKDLMTKQKREIDSAYFIPNLKLWFNENLLYPFVGGDTVGYEEEPILNLIPSINLILPYVEPKFIRGANYNGIYELSMTCLENAKNIMQTLEIEYQRIYERKLTLKRLSEVMISPRVPDRGKDISYDLNIEPSRYIENDINLLMRLRKSK